MDSSRPHVYWPDRGENVCELCHREMGLVGHRCLDCKRHLEFLDQVEEAAELKATMPPPLLRPANSTTLVKPERPLSLCCRTGECVVWNCPNFSGGAPRCESCKLPADDDIHIPPASTRLELGTPVYDQFGTHKSRGIVTWTPMCARQFIADRDAGRPIRRHPPSAGLGPMGMNEYLISLGPGHSAVTGNSDRTWLPVPPEEWTNVEKVTNAGWVWRQPYTDEDGNVPEDETVEWYMLAALIPTEVWESAWDWGDARSVSDMIHLLAEYLDNQELP